MLGILHSSQHNPASRQEIPVQLPKYKKKKRIKLKICQYCGKEFWGHPIAKYCELHRDVKQREKTKKSPEPGDSNNRTYSHDFIEVGEETWICELEGCGKSYVVKIFPKQFVYPRFCEEHRNEFRRRNWVRAKQVEELRKARVAATPRQPAPSETVPASKAKSAKVGVKPAAKPAAKTAAKAVDETKASVAKSNPVKAAKAEPAPKAKPAKAKKA